MKIKYVRESSQFNGLREIRILREESYGVYFEMEGEHYLVYRNNIKIFYGIYNKVLFSEKEWVLTIMTDGKILELCTGRSVLG